MAIKKSDLYSSLWASCDELRGGMDASQYKDYVLFMLFIKYVSDKYAGQMTSRRRSPSRRAPASRTWSRSRASSDIGDKINKQIIAAAGRGQLAPRPQRLPRLQRPEQARRRQGDGRAAHQPHRHLREPGARFLEEPRRERRPPRRRLRIPHAALRHRERQEQGPVLHAVRSQPHHRQGYRHLAGQHHRRHHRLRPHLRLRLAAAEGRDAEAGKHITLDGQEKDVDHRRSRPHEHDPARLPDGQDLSGNTLSDPKFKDGEQLRTFDYVVANPPFSDKTLVHRPRSRRRRQLATASSASPGACRPRSRATTPTCCTSSAR